MKKITVLITAICLFTFFSIQASAELIATCKVGGCSGQLCESSFNEPMTTTCEWREEYACYKKAKCQWQSNGKCGWTKTDELTKCLKEKTIQDYNMDTKND